MKYVKRTKRQQLTRVESVVRGLYNIPQVLYDALILRSITIANIIMIYDIAGDVVVQGVLRLAPPPVPLMCGHLSCTDTFAWCRGCLFMTGTTVVEVSC